jgi:polyhydroxyalkanoate synthesis regulator phasin
MNNSRPIVNISLLLGTIIAVSAFFLVFNNIPVQALHKEQQLLESFDDLADFAKAVRNGDEDIEEIPIQSMKAADIYDDADDSLKDCIDQAAEIGDSLTDREVVHCVDDVNYFNNKYSNSTVPTTATSTATGSADTGTDTTSTSDTADTTSTSDNSNENNLVDELVKTGKFTEAEAREFVNNNMQSGTGTDTTSDTTSTSNADTNTADTNTADTNTADTKTTSNADTNTADTKTTSNADTNTDNSSASNDTSLSNNEDNNDQSSNNNSNNPEDYDDLDELVKDIKNGNVDTDKISLSAFQDSGAYKGADQETQDCIDLAGKIGDNLGDQEIVNCSEDPNFYKNEISNTNDNTNDNNAEDSSNSADENSDSSNDINN